MTTTAYSANSAPGSMLSLASCSVELRAWHTCCDATCSPDQWRVHGRDNYEGGRDGQERTRVWKARPIDRSLLALQSASPPPSMPNGAQINGPKDYDYGVLGKTPKAKRGVRRVYMCIAVAAPVASPTIVISSTVTLTCSLFPSCESCDEHDGARGAVVPLLSLAPTPAASSTTLTRTTPALSTPKNLSSSATPITPSPNETSVGAQSLSTSLQRPRKSPTPFARAHNHASSQLSPNSISAIE